MGVTVQVRDLDADVQEKLRGAAAREGLSLSAFLRRELTRLAEQVDVRAKADALNASASGARNALGVDPAFWEGTSAQEIVARIREDRDSR